MRLLLFILLLTTSCFAQDSESNGPYVELRSGERIEYDEIDLSKGMVIGVKDGKETSHSVEKCKYAVLSKLKKNKLVLKRQVVFASRKLARNLGGEAPIEEGTVPYNIVVKNGDDMIVYRKSLSGGGVAGNQTIYYHVKGGMVSQIGITEWRNDSYMSEFVKTFGLCSETKAALQKFKSSGKGSRQVKYDFFMQSLEKKYLLNCIN